MYPMNSTGDLTAAHMTGAAAAIILSTLAAVAAGAAIYIGWAMRQARKDRLRRPNRAQRWDREMVDVQFDQIMRDLVRDGGEQ